MTITKNNLSKSSSPYLLQHQENPVHWQEWSDEVLELAKKEDKCLLISIGYSACHWCHVMAHESFEDEEVADIMNKHFINIKIDREERPDIDQIYMDAAQILTGRGGWPLNAFALPDGKPFYAGTYFPKENWIKVLENIAQAYQEQPDTILNTAERLTESIKSQDVLEDDKSSELMNEEALITNYKSWFKHIDFNQGGIDKAPKFPMPCIWQSLLEYYTIYKDEKALNALEVTLDKMYHGGIYDWVGGGFSRYSVDGKWFAPHFEKMLYDNAQLLSLYADTFKVTQNPTYKQCIEDTIGFLNKDLRHESLGYFSALDADSEGEEGLFYTWTTDELESLLSPVEMGIATSFFDLKSSGNWENKRNILAQTKPVQALAEEFEVKTIDIEKHLRTIKSKLNTTREKRVKPGLDNKLITAHNAMMVKGLVKSYQATQSETYKQMALDLMQSLSNNAMRPDGSLQRLLNKKNSQGFLDDYAFTIEALLYCYEITFETHYLKKAEHLINYTLTHFAKENRGLFYYTSKDSMLIARKMELSDNVIPSSNAVLAGNLWKIGHLLSKPEYTDHAEQMMVNVQHLYDKYSLYFCTWHQLHLAVLKGQIEVAVTGPEFSKIIKDLQKHYWPFTLFCGGTKEDLPQLSQKIQSDNSQIFICQNQTCTAPQTNVEESVEMLKSKIR